jgi:hypothetical protein
MTIGDQIELLISRAADLDREMSEEAFIIHRKIKLARVKGVGHLPRELIRRARILFGWTVEAEAKAKALDPASPSYEAELRQVIEFHAAVVVLADLL